MRSLLLFMLVGLVAGCTKTPKAEAVGDLDGRTSSEKSEALPQAPQLTLDQSSPDRALKSYWQVVDAVNKLVYERTTNGGNEFGELIYGLQDRVALGGYYSAIRSHKPILETYERDITDVEVQSQTRAVVHATIRNSTLIPEGAEVSDYDRRARKDGEKYRYVLEKDGDKWMVAEMWHFDSLLDKDWVKLLPKETKPQVSTATYEGV